MSSFALSPHSLTVHVLESEKMDKFLEALDCWFFYCEFRSMFIFYDIWLNILNGSRQSSDTSRSCQAWLLGFYFRSCPSHWQSKYPLSLRSKNSGDKSAWGWICSNWIQLNLMGFSFPPSRPFNLSLWRRNMISETDRFVDFGTTKFSSFRSQHVF